MIPTTDLAHRLPDAFNNPGAFMAQNNCIGAARLPQADVSVADATGDEPHQYFVLAWHLHLQTFDLHRPVWSSRDSGFDPLRGRDSNMGHRFSLSNLMVTRFIRPRNRPHELTESL